MTSTDEQYAAWPGAPRTLARAVDAAIGAGQAQDREAFADALAALQQIDREQLLVLLGTSTQQLLERAAPDGLEAEEAERVLTGCLRAAAPWYDALDGTALLRALTDALGVVDPDDDAASTVSPDAVLAHGLLLVAHLCTVTRTPPAEVLGFALGELRRAQTVELP